MKSASRLKPFLMLATLLGFSGPAMFAQTPANSKGTAIIFSAPKSGTVSSNLNELRTPASPFREMEATLKKPFESFSPDRAAEVQRPVFRNPAATAQPEMRKKTLKETLNDRAEQMFLEPDMHKGETDDDLFGLTGESYDPYEKKNKTSLDRYYDRVDRISTNRAGAQNFSRDTLKANDSLNRNSQGLLANPESPASPRNPFNPSAPGSEANNPFATPPRDGSFSSRSFYNQPDRVNTYQNEQRFSGFRQSQETRIDAFKRLLQGSYGQADSKNALPPTPASSAPYRSTPVITSTPTGASESRNGGASPTKDTFADAAKLVGTPTKPQGVPDYTTSSETVPVSTPPPKPLPPPTFKLPQRRL